ncbi:MAG: ArnT family glycosyltransferase [Planctomycetota bacterium]|jgi:hypothetical protein
MKKESNIPTKYTCFWVFALFITIWPSFMLARDITKPFCGLHSWGHAHDAWVARSHVKYGLGYTKGFDTFAVGNPPTTPPSRYLDHPVLFTLLNSAAMLIFGVNEWSLRLANILATAVTILLFIKIVRALADDITALLAGLIFAMFPITCYFGVNMWLYPLCFWSFWCYLTIIGGLKNDSEPRKLHWITLPIALFIMIQLTWEGFFFAMAIGIHYVCHCLHNKKIPNKILFAILAIPPFASLALNFVIMAAGSNWDFQRIAELIKWRAGSGEMKEHNWPAWFERLWQWAVYNFSLPVLIVTLVYLTIGQFFILTSAVEKEKQNQVNRKFPQFWLFFMPPFFQLFILKGALWPHQYWERPLTGLIAISAAMAIMLLVDIVKTVSKKLSIVTAIIPLSIFFVFCLKGTNYYHSVRWQPLNKIKMFKELNEKIPPDKALLSFEPFIIDQHKAKQASYRPEVAWYLDRDIVPIRKIENGKILVNETIEQIREMAKTGKYPYYLIPYMKELSRLINGLAQFYQYEIREGEQGERTKDNKFLKQGMYPYIIFDLNSKRTD